MPVVNVDLQASNDLTNWTLLGRTSAFNTIGTDTASITSIAYQYIRLSVTLINGDGIEEVAGLAIMTSEVEFSTQ